MSEPQRAASPVPTPSPAVRPRRRIARRLGRALLAVLVLIAVLAGIAALYARHVLHASLAQTDGEVRLAGLAAPVRVERDALGTPTVHAASRIDAARAVGFLHGQERFFQMDLNRRMAAGELAELFGRIALPMDRKNRVHRFRAEARQILAGLPAEDRKMLDAYTAGVEAGRQALDGPPFEYALLRTAPAPWRSEDSILTVLAMFINLQEPDSYREPSRGLMQELLPPELNAFLAPRGTEWDAPVLGEPFATPPLPGPEVVDLRKPEWQPGAASPGHTAALLPALAAEASASMVGSNAWAVAGSHTADGRALLANDMHLPLSVPNIWYRASVAVPDGAGGTRRLTGVTLPGTPFFATASTGQIAWGFTDSYVDWHDTVLLDTDPQNPEVYRTPQGPRKIEHFSERIQVKGGAAETLDVLWTVWGPVTGQDHNGRPQVLSWIAHHPDAVNFQITRLESARTVDEAVEIAHASGIPVQSFLVADAGGRIAWTYIGRIPRRTGFDGRTPTSWADGTRRWDGWLATDEVPKLVDPPSGRLWSANNRLVSGADLDRVGDGGYDIGARAHQIRDDLMALDKATPRDLLAIQLDDRALFLERWRKVLLAALTDQAVAGHPQRAELRRILTTGWTGRASVDSAAYGVVRNFRNELAGAILPPLASRCAAADIRFNVFLAGQMEAPLWALVEQRPAHLLAPQFADWDAALLAAVDTTLADGMQGRQAPSAPAARTWGEQNTLRLNHPLGAAVPFLGRWLNMPQRPLPGDANMPRVQLPGFGASERLVVSPGHEEAGLFHMPGGESGNPLSPHYRDGEPAWETGAPTPFLPGPAESTLTLVP